MRVQWRRAMETKQYSTSTLMDILTRADVQDIRQYDQNYLQGRSCSFAAYMDELIAQRKLKRQELLQRADLPQKYGYKLLTGESITRDRDKLLRIFLALQMSLKEVRCALELYGMPPLYPKIRRDAIFIIAFNRKIYSIEQVNRILMENQETPLNRCRD